MLDRIRQLWNEFAFASDDAAVHFAPDDHRVAVAALLVHLLDTDGVVSDAERTKLATLLKEHFHLDNEATRALILEATERDHEAIDLYSFTSLLKRSLNHGDRLEVIDMMWELVFADGSASELEDNVVWRVAELLGIEGRERIALKQRVIGRKINDHT